VPSTEQDWCMGRLPFWALHNRIVSSLVLARGECRMSVIGFLTEGSFPDSGPLSCCMPPASTPAVSGAVKTSEL